MEHDRGACCPKQRHACSHAVMVVGSPAYLEVLLRGWQQAILGARNFGGVGDPPTL